jgi:hypothetical protein
MKVYKFTVAEHEEFGSLGFRPAWYPQGDPLGGMAVAHDILEHFPKDDGSAEGEWQALGASLYIRGNSGYYARNGSASTPEQNIASDLPTVFGVLRSRDGRSFAKPCKPSRDAEVMSQAREAVSCWLRECEYMSEEDRPDATTCERVACWIAKGYQRAKVRYKTHGAGNVAYGLFAQIEEGADKALKHADEGMVLTVRVDFRALNVSLDCDYPHEEGGDYGD